MSKRGAPPSDDVKTAKARKKVSSIEDAAAVSSPSASQLDATVSSPPVSPSTPKWEKRDRKASVSADSDPGKLLQPRTISELKTMPESENGLYMIALVAGVLKPPIDGSRRPCEFTLLDGAKSAIRAVTWRMDLFERIKVGQTYLFFNFGLMWTTFKGTHGEVNSLQLRLHDKSAVTGSTPALELIFTVDDIVSLVDQSNYLRIIRLPIVQAKIVGMDARGLRRYPELKLDGTIGDTFLEKPCRALYVASKDGNKYQVLLWDGSLDNIGDQDLGDSIRLLWVQLRLAGNSGFFLSLAAAREDEQIVPEFFLAPTEETSLPVPAAGESTAIEQDVVEKKAV